MAQAPSPSSDPSMGAVLEAARLLAGARSLDAVVDALRSTARAALEADGIAVVLNRSGQCFYAAEDAMARLWLGQTFDNGDCLSGLSMQTGEVVCVDDVLTDARVPIALYAPTFVRSLIIAPIGTPAVAALCIYWSRPHVSTPASRDTLIKIADAAAQALNSIEEAEGDRFRRSTLHAVLESVSDCFYAVDEDWRMVAFNRASEAYFGLARETVVGRSLWELFPEGEARPFGDYCRRAMHGREHVEFQSPSALRPGRSVQIRMAPMDGGI